MKHLAILAAFCVLGLGGCLAGGDDDDDDDQEVCNNTVDDDGDGHIDCADQDCATAANCTGPVCGNGTCELGEDSTSCPGDCAGITCDDDGVCEPGETTANCPGDCPAPVCGDGTCDAGETSTNCPADCGTGPVCGNGVCEAGETSTNCPADCTTGPVCGNGVCEAGETSTNCPADCATGPVCGNGVCESGETTTNCPADCAATCDIDASLGALGALSGQVDLGSTANPASYMLYLAAVNDDAKPDVAVIELYQGYGVFSTSIAPGTYTLSGVELDYAICGLCVRVYTDFDSASGTGTQWYMATGGTVTLTSVSGNLTGSLSGVGLTHVELGSGGATTIIGDCTSSISSASFTAPIPAP